MNSEFTEVPSLELKLLRDILWRREGGNRDKYRGELAIIRRGIDRFSEHYAYRYVYPALREDAPESQKVALLRTAALVAEFDSIPMFERSDTMKHKSFGRWCAEVSRAWAQRNVSRDSETGPEQGTLKLDPRKNDAIASKLTYLHTQDLEEAIRTVYRLLQIANSLSPAPSIDYLELYRMFSRWGNGISEASRAVRMRPLKDYYSAFGSLSDEDSKPTE